MRIRSALHAVLVAVVAGTSTALAAAQDASAPRIAVGANAQVSTDFPRTAHYEFVGAAAPHNATRLIACSMQVDQHALSLRSVVFMSDDGGKNWRSVFVSPKSAEDPICTFGNDGTAYFLAISVPGVDSTVLWSSKDDGHTWSKVGGLPDVDREYLTIDRTGGKYNGRMYMNATTFPQPLDPSDTLSDGLGVFRSLDGGKTFLGPAQRIVIPPEWIWGMANSVVLSDGTLVSLFGQMNNSADLSIVDRPNLINGKLWVVTSDDGGETLSQGHQVARWHLDRARTEGTIPMLAVDPGSAAFKDRLYAVWIDAASGDIQIHSAYSSDKGKSWSDPVRVDDSPFSATPEKGPDAVMPTIAANRNGVVGVAWYDRRGQADDIGWHLRFAASYDGGETWTPSVQVSSVANRYRGKEDWPINGYVSRGESSPPRIVGGFNLGAFFLSPGHTSGIAADAAGVFHPFWTDNRTGYSQVWTAPIRASGFAMRNGSALLASLDDITSQVTIELSDTRYDPRTHRITMSARLKNDSKTAVYGPMTVRLLELNSPVGPIHVANASNGQLGSGATWSFTSLLDGEMLKPGAHSRSQALVFAVKPERYDRFDKNLFVANIQAVVLGKTARR